MVTKIHKITVTDRTLLASSELLYSNLCHDLGLKAVQNFLCTKRVQFKAHNNLVLSLLEFLLPPNYFLYRVPSIIK